MVNMVLDRCKTQLQILQVELDALLDSQPVDVTAVRDLARRTSAVAANLEAAARCDLSLAQPPGS